MLIFPQITYFIDEASNVGKGGNIIISMLHHFLKTHRFGKTYVHFHADNCSGQNKNRYLMAYFMWRILTGLHEQIKISFLPVGHNKICPRLLFQPLQMPLSLNKDQLSRWHCSGCKSVHHSKCSTACGNSRWQHFCSNVWMEYIFR